MATELPPEPTLFHILPRLPARSVLRFKCVSKQWHEFLTTPIFKRLHLQHINKQDHHNPNKVLVLSTSEVPSKFYSFDCETPENGLTPCPDLPFEPNPRLIRFLTSFHGLVCVGIKKDVYDNRYSDLVLWNPLTCEYKTLSKGNYHNECYKISGRAFSLYYTSFDDDYKLLRVTNDVYIYSLKSDSWRKVLSSGYIPYIPNVYSWKPSIWFNENLYFLRKLKYRSSSPLYSILRFDTKKEEFRRIATPTFKNNWAVNILSFSVLRGCIHLSVAYEKFGVTNSTTKVELWRMDGGGGWTKVVKTRSTLSLSTWLKNGALHMMRNGNFIMRLKDDQRFSGRSGEEFKNCVVFFE